MVLPNSVAPRNRRRAVARQDAPAQRGAEERLRDRHDDLSVCRRHYRGLVDAHRGTAHGRDRPHDESCTSAGHVREDHFTVGALDRSEEATRADGTPAREQHPIDAAQQLDGEGKCQRRHAVGLEDPRPDRHREVAVGDGEVHRPAIVRRGDLAARQLDDRRRAGRVVHPRRERSLLHLCDLHDTAGVRHAPILEAREQPVTASRPSPRPPGVPLGSVDGHRPAARPRDNGS